MAKADLIKEAEAHGMELTGYETIAELKELITAAVEAEGGDDNELPIGHADYDAVPERAGTGSDSANEVVPAMTEDERLRLEPTDEEKQNTIGLDSGDGVNYNYITIPEPQNDNRRARRLLINGKNYEHVHDDAEHVR